MFFALRNDASRWWHRPWSAYVSLATSVLLVTGVMAAPSSARSSGLGHSRAHHRGHRQTNLFSQTAARVQADLPSVGPFQRGDVFVAGDAGIQEYAPTGHLRQTISGRSGTMCFNPNGTRLIVLGVGLFESSGNQLPSNWGAITGAHCVVDGRGHVYVSGEPGAPLSTFTKHDLAGTTLRTFTVTTLPASAFQAMAIDLAPDDCSMYWASSDGLVTASGQFNVCTNVEEPPPVYLNSGVDDLRVLPNGQVIAANDRTAELDAPTGQVLQRYIPPSTVVLDQWLRRVSLDPDGTSFWACCHALFADGTSGPYQIERFDIQSGQQLAQWTAGIDLPGIAVDAAPLLGDANIGDTVDSDAPGTAEAFATRAGYSGQMSRLHLWVDSSSTASQVVVGIYSDQNGQPHALQTQATIGNLNAGSWNYVDVPSVAVTAGKRYWIAVLGPKGRGTIRFRDATRGGRSYTSAKQNLTALPAQWSSGERWASSPLSGYGG